MIDAWQWIRVVIPIATLLGSVGWGIRFPGDHGLPAIQGWKSSNGERILAADTRVGTMESECAGIGEDDISTDLILYLVYGGVLSHRVGYEITLFVWARMVA
ncbi:hypothetical protein SLA2020_313930 [Shorea laevis]